MMCNFCKKLRQYTEKKVLKDLRRTKDVVITDEEIEQLIDFELEVLAYKVHTMEMPEEDND